MQDITDKIKAHANKLGFCALGITNQHMPGHYKHYLSWVNLGYQQNMWYLSEESRKQKRASAKNLLPNLQSVLVGAISYHTKEPHPSKLKFARYGWGLDYHQFVKEKFRALQTYMIDDLGLDFDAKITTDTAPILEKDFALLAGVGWMGKNTMIINRQDGSYIYLGALLISLKLDADQATTAHCGSCTACIDACPTQAIEAPFLLNPAKCISYHTIENKDQDIPDSIKPHLDGWIAGCDICQEVCPWNNKAKIAHLPETKPLPHTTLTAKQIATLSPSEHKQLFAPTSFSRIKREKLQQNTQAATKTVDR